MAFVAYLWHEWGSLGIVPMVGIAGVSVALAVRYAFRNKMRIFFKHSGLATEEKAPHDTVKKTSYGELHTIRMLPGQSSEDYEDKKLALEQYLNCRAEMEFKQGQLYIKCHSQDLGNMYPYQYFAGKKPLEVTIGKTLTGYLTIDLEDMVHLLIGGETGGGKSVLLRNLVTSLVLNNRCVLHLVDRKRVELGIFKRCKCVDDFISEDDDIIVLLDKMKSIAKSRLADMENKNAVTIGSDVVRHVVIFDEFGDIDSKDIKSALAKRISQDRAVGIHYILCTQHPIKEVVTSVIKNNMPGRIATKVASYTASGVILDQPGAQDLKVVGRMLCKSGGEIKEFQGFFLLAEKDKKRPNIPAVMDLLKDMFVDKQSKRATKPDTCGKEPYEGGCEDDVVGER